MYRVLANELPKHFSRSLLKRVFRMMNLCLADLLFFIELEQAEVFEELDRFCFGEGRLRDFIEVSFPKFIGDLMGDDDTWGQVSENDIRFDHSIGPFGVPRLAPREGEAWWWKHGLASVGGCWPNL